MSMFSEFRAFINKGSLVDLAIGIVIGAAFGEVTKSFVEGMFMPLVGLLFKVGDLDKAKWVLSDEVKDAAGKIVTPESAVNYGHFIGAVLNFIIVAFVMFMVIRAMNKMKKATPPPAPAGPTPDQMLLAEIRDALKK